MGSERGSDRPRPLLYRRRFLPRDVRHAESATDAHLLHVEARDEGCERLDLLFKGSEQEDLAADVRVDADEVHRRRLDAATNGCFSCAAGDGEAELRVLLARHDVLVGVGLDPRRHTHQHLRHGTGAVAPQLLQAVELVVTVNHDPTDADLQGMAELRRALVVAVEDELTRWHTGAGGHVDLARGGDVDAEPFFVRDARHGLA